MTERDMARGDLCRVLPDASYYLAENDAVTGEDPAKFAVIKVGGDIAGNHLEAFSGSIDHLVRLGLIPTIVHGGGPQISQALEEGGFESQFADGVRVTPSEQMDTIEDALGAVNTAIATSLEQQGVPVVGLLKPLQAQFKDQEKYGMVGIPTGVDVAKIREIIASGKVPLLGCLGTVAMEGSQQTVNINGDDAAAELVRSLDPNNYIALTGTRGVTESPEGGRIVPVLTDKEATILIDEGIIGGGMKKKVVEAQRLIQKGVTDEVVLTSPADIVRELFTHEGGGTLITHEASFRQYSGTEGINKKDLSKMIEDAFGGHLDEDYFDQPDIKAVHVTAQTYDGVVVIRQPEDTEASYMDKLAVAPRAQGRGIPKQLIARASEDSFSGLFWRADPAAEFLKIYDEVSDQAQNVTGLDGKQWRVFVKNVSPDEIDKVVKWAAAQPITITRHPKSEDF